MQNNHNIPNEAEVRIRLYKCRAGEMINVHIMKTASQKIRDGNRYSFKFQDGRLYFVEDNKGLRIVGGMMTTMNTDLVKSMNTHDIAGLYHLYRDAQNKRFYVNLSEKLSEENDTAAQLVVRPVEILETAERSQRVSELIRKAPESAKKCTENKVTRPVEEVGDSNVAKGYFIKKLIEAVKGDNLERAKLIVEFIEDFEEVVR